MNCRRSTNRQSQLRHIECVGEQAPAVAIVVYVIQVRNEIQDLAAGPSRWSRELAEVFIDQISQ